MITSNNIILHEFIGLDTEITNSSNTQVIGINGRIVDETKSMFTVNTKNGIKTIAKSINNWKFSIAGKDIIVDGSKIVKRPFDRIGVKV